MNRCLHITIHEDPGSTPRRATAPPHGQSGSDPASQFVISPIDDPASQFVISPIDDPAPQFVISPIDDPDAAGLGYISSASGGYGKATATVHSCGCQGNGGAQANASVSTTPHPFIAPGDFSGGVIVRMAPGIDPTPPNLWELAGPPEKPRLPGLKAVLELPFKDEDEKAAKKDPKKPRHLISSPLVELKEGSASGSQHGYCGHLLPRDKALEHIRYLEERTATTAFPPLHSLAAYWRLDLREHPGRAEEVVAQLNLLAEVDLAYRELSANDPRDEAAGRLFDEDQGYLSDAPAGISASWAWQHLEDWSKARSLTICDLEQGWKLEHKYFRGENILSGLIYGANRDLEGIPGHHGTAVLGQLVAAGRFKGAAPGLGRFVLASHYLSKNERDAHGQPHRFAGTNGHVAAALMQALNNGVLKKGDVLLLEVQRGLLPAEVDAADFDAIRLASGLGVLVVEAAGNGGFNLDAWSDPATGRSLRRGDPRDSGAVLVGASRASVPHDRAPFSNYGSRLDCFGWGEAVTTCGYGDLYYGTADDDLFTNSFSGTSSASPIIAGAAALLQALHAKQTGFELEPRAMRALLSDPATGTRQGPNVHGHIGVMPDLKAIVNGLQIVPVVYMRRSVRDDGSTPGPDDEISSSPDIFLCQGNLTRTIDHYGEGRRRENLPAPGDPMVTARLSDTANNHLYVRLRNRGLYEGGARIRLFASPAATLITPEHWIPWGLLDIVDPPGSTAGIIPQGDTLFVAGPVSPVFGLNDAHPNTLWSFLAVLSPPVESCPYSHFNFVNWMAELPPGPPYFDWTQYRAFLRQPGVAWRNTHRVAVTAGNQDLHMPFFIAGTPDRARLFDFEVIQQLPKGAIVTLQMPPALEAKLRQRQPWLGSGSLPKQPRTAIRGVSLAPGMPDKATFRVQADPNTLKGSHSLAIRQLWHGEEVGRITWYFGLD